MYDVQRYATSTIEPGRRLLYWNDLIERIYPGTWVNTPRPDFRAEMSSFALGDLAMLRPRSGPVVVGRNARDGSEERLILHLSTFGRLAYEQATRTIDLNPGDFVIGRTDLPYRLAATDHELLIVEFPRVALLSRVADLAEHLNRPVVGHRPAARVLHDYLLSLWRLHGNPGLDDAWEAGASSVFYDLLALALRPSVALLPAAPANASLKARVLGIADAELCDPGLNSAHIAERCGVSVRTVQAVFAAMNTTPSGWVLEQRLLRAATGILSGDGRSITLIAFDLGFNDSGYFTRCFRRRFGIAPREWRRTGGC